MTTTPPTASWRTRMRWLLPLVAIAIPLGVWALLWRMPLLEGLDLWRRNFATQISIMLGMLFLVIWLLFFSGLRWVARLGILAVAVAAWFAAVKSVSFDGDMRAYLHLRWQDDAAYALEAHRASQKRLDTEVVLASVTPTDYLEYRGPKRDGVITGPELARDWSKTPPKRRWVQPAGAGYASFVVQGPVAVTIEQRRDNEAVVAYDTATGSELWTYSYPAHFKEAMGGPGPRATPTIADGEVYALGAQGDLVCLDLKSGKKKWAVNVLKDNKNIIWAMSGSPLVYENLVIVNPGAQAEGAKGKALRAFNRADGNLVWSSGDTEAGYSSPELATIAGKLQILMFDAKGLGAYDPKDGKKLWWYEWPAYQGINVAQPLVLEGDKVLISTGYDKGSALLQISNKDGAWGAKESWTSTSLRSKFASPVFYKGYIYGLDDGILACIDPKTGKKKWKDGRYGHGQILLTGDLIVVLTEKGKLALVEATPEGFHELGSIQALDKGEKTWNPLALANGVAYVRNHEQMACYELPLAEKK